MGGLNNTQGVGIETRQAGNVVRTRMTIEPIGLYMGLGTFDEILREVSNTYLGDVLLQFDRRRIDYQGKREIEDELHLYFYNSGGLVYHEGTKIPLFMDKNTMKIDNNKVVLHASNWVSSTEDKGAKEGLMRPRVVDILGIGAEVGVSYVWQPGTAEGIFDTVYVSPINMDTLYNTRRPIVAGRVITNIHEKTKETKDNRGYIKSEMVGGDGDIIIKTGPDTFLEYYGVTNEFREFKGNIPQVLKDNFPDITSHIVDVGGGKYVYYNFNRYPYQTSPTYSDSESQTWEYNKNTQELKKVVGNYGTGVICFYERYDDPDNFYGVKSMYYEHYKISKATGVGSNNNGLIRKIDAIETHGFGSGTSTSHIKDEAKRVVQYKGSYLVDGYKNNNSNVNESMGEMLQLTELSNNPEAVAGIVTNVGNLVELSSGEYISMGYVEAQNGYSGYAQMNNKEMGMVGIMGKPDIGWSIGYGVYAGNIEKTADTQFTASIVMKSVDGSII